MIVFKLHGNPDFVLVGVADSEVLGKVYEDKNGFLDLKEYADFYQGDEVTTEKLEGLLQNLLNEPKYSINAVGKKSVAIIKKKFNCSERKIQGVPHVQVYKF